MTSQKDRKLYDLGIKDKDFSKTVHTWLAQYEEEDDFLSDRDSNDRELAQRKLI